MGHPWLRGPSCRVYRAAGRLGGGPPGTPTRWLLSGDVGLVERGAQRLGEGDGVAGGPEVGVEQPRGVVQGVVVQGHHGDPAAAQRARTCWTSPPVIAKSPLMAACPPPRGWKFRAVV